jgi:hypothetical protein
VASSRTIHTVLMTALQKFQISGPESL